MKCRACSNVESVFVAEGKSLPPALRILCFFANITRRILPIKFAQNSHFPNFPISNLLVLVGDRNRHQQFGKELSATSFLAEVSLHAAKQFNWRFDEPSLLFVCREKSGVPEMISGVSKRLTAFLDQSLSAINPAVLTRGTNHECCKRQLQTGWEP